MKKLARFGVSIDAELLRRFDKFLETTDYINRSEAFRDLIRTKLVDEEVRNAGTAAFGVFSFVYDHHKRELEHTLTHLQHDHHSQIIATTHVHIDHDHCLEVILLKGTVGTIKNIASKLAGLKGVNHSKLMLTSTEHPL